MSLELKRRKARGDKTMQTHFKTNTQPWLVRAALMMVAPMIGCDPGGDTEDLADAADDESSADEGDESDDVEFRDVCARPASPPTADVNTTLAGAATSVTRSGSGTGTTSCDLFAVRVATPSGHRAREIIIEGNYAGPVDAAAYAWKRTCTTPPPGFPVACTPWQDLDLDALDIAGGCWDDVPQIGDVFCFGSVDGGGDIPANSYTDILVGARVEYDGTDNSLPIEITVSE
jgi:hypothetical protein